jgi:hypothetical protein
VRPIWISPIALVAIVFATVVSAQVVDQNTRQQIEQLTATFVGDWNRMQQASAASTILVFIKSPRGNENDGE